MENPASERGLDTVLGLIRGAGRAEDVIDLLVDYVGSRWDGCALFRRDGDLLVPWLGVGARDGAALEKYTVSLLEPNALAYLAKRPAMMTGALTGTETEQTLARLLIGGDRCQALAMSIAVGIDIRYVLFACRDHNSDPADKDEYRTLLGEVVEKLARLRALNQAA